MMFAKKSGDRRLLLSDVAAHDRDINGEKDTLQRSGTCAEMTNGQVS